MNKTTTHIFPAQLPPGFSYLAKEPSFDPSRHLQLERPTQVRMLTEFGYDEDAVSRFASPVAMTSPVRVLSSEGVAAIREVVEALQDSAPRGTGTHEPIFNVACRSRFVRDLSLNPEITAFFAEHFSTSLIPHTMLHLQTQMNLNSVALEDSGHGWHHDIAAFAYVLMIHDPADIEGGHFEYFDGTREKAAELLDSNDGLPVDSVVHPIFPGPGYACFMQGSAICHRVGPLFKPGMRCTLVNAFCSTNLDVSDVNRIHFVDDYLYDPQYARYKAMDYARHKAWRTREKLDHFLHETSFTDDSRALVELLKDAVADVQSAIATIENGKMSAEDAYRSVREQDRKMMS